MFLGPFARRTGWDAVRSRPPPHPLRLRSGMTKAARLALVLLGTFLFLTPSGCNSGECGNGRVEAGEQCDDGNTASDDGCSATCVNEGATPPRCGDGKVDIGEQCDDGNSNNEDNCQNNCRYPPLSQCGNGQQEVGEACDDGNTTDGDGCQADCSLTPSSVIQCLGANTAALASGATCEVTRTGSAWRLFTGMVLKDGETLQGGQVLVDDQGVIQCAACDCSASAGAAEATVVSCPQGVISPGLINAHDHITFQSAPRERSEERYEHRHDWRKGNDGHTFIPTNDANNDGIRWGELRQVMAGTTSVAGSGGQPGLLRNLDKDSVTTTGGNQEGLDEPPLNYETFPLGDSGGGELTSGCAYPGVVGPGAIPRNSAFLPHLGEGIETSARNEIRCVSGVAGGVDHVMRPQTAIIHGIGVTAEDIGVMASRGTDLIWSPRSNVSLYGDTAMVTAYKRMGVTVALGSDWLPSGSMNILRELQCADYLSANYYAHAFSDEELWRMVTANAAELTDTQEKLGRLAPGKVADLAIFRLRVFERSPHRAILTANPEDVVLTLRGGKPLYGDKALVASLTADACDTLPVCGSDKAVCLQSEVAKDYITLAAANLTGYPLFFCGQAPTHEPTCAPRRASTSASVPASVNGSTFYSGARVPEDKDGDGVPDASDNCPIVFNPVRPLDNGAQADTDGDRVGDACDPCPLAAGTTECAAPPADDEDGDGVLLQADNCPHVANPEQLDTDGDGRGDACDPCFKANPGSALCAVTLQEIKTPVNGAWPLEGTVVTLDNVLVTAVHSTGFFLQAKEGDPGYQGPAWSGLYVYDNPPPKSLLPGDRISLTRATVKNFNGQLQLDNVAFTQKSAGEALPAPVVVRPEEVRTGGARAQELEGVRVELQGVFVTRAENSFREFIVDSVAASSPDTAGVDVDDLLHAYPTQGLGTEYRALRGVLAYRFGASKVHPTGAADFVLPPPPLKALGPSGQYVRVGAAGPSFPSALTVELEAAYFEDVSVFVGTNNPSALTVAGNSVIVPKGQTSAVVKLEPHAQAESVTVTAMLPGSAKTATVRVLAADEPGAVSLTPARPVLQPGDLRTFTVELDVPAPEDMPVTLSVSPAGFGGLASPTVVIPRNALRATFDFQLSAQAAAGSTGTVTATLGNGVSTRATVDVAASVPQLLSLTPEGLITVFQDTPRAFTVTLSAPALYDTPVDLRLEAPEGKSLGSVPALVVVPTGQTSATFTFSPNTTEEVDGIVHALLSHVGHSTRVEVRAAPPRLASVTVDSPLLRSGSTASVTVTLDKPAQGDTGVALKLAGDEGSVETTATVLDGATSATVPLEVNVTPAGSDVTGAATLSGTVDGVLFRTAAVTLWRHGLVINEVDYDNIESGDPKEFVEVLNTGTAPLNLAHVALIFVNGEGAKEYRRQSLAALGTLAPGEYLVVGSAAVTVPSGTKRIDVAPGASGFFQNGAPDAVGLFDVTDATRPVLLDSLSYEGAVKGAIIGSLAFNLQEGADSETSFADRTSGAEGSLSRIPDGQDTDSNVGDFVFTPMLTPGAANAVPGP